MKKTTLFLLLIFAFQFAVAQSVVLDGKTYTVDTLSNFKVGPGTQYTALRLKSTSRLDVFFLKVDASNPYISFKAVLGRDSIYTGEQPSAMAKRKSKEGAVYFAGTNGDFYATTGYVGLPIGCTMIDGQIATPPASSWKSVTFDQNNIPGIGVLTYSVKAKKGTETWTVNRVNHLRAENQMVLFNQHNGKRTRTNAYGTEVLLQLADGEVWGVNKTVKAKVVKIENNVGNMAIPTGFAVLSGHGTSQTLLNTLVLNDEIQLEFSMLLDGVAAPFNNIVGGESRAPMLKNGVVEQTDIWNELHPRTGIGYSEDKKTVIYCVVDGRGLSAGVTTKQLAQLMQTAGAYNAFNMDGGGSSCMYVKDFGPMNTPSDGTERAVANGIFAVSSAPTDNTISEIKSYTRKIQLPHYGVFMPKFIAYNQYGTLLNKDLQGVVLSCSPEVGEIASDGRFVASGNQGGMVTATYNNIQTQFQVELIASAEVAFRLDSVLINNLREYPIQVQSVIGINTMDVLPAALTWTVSDPSVCSVDNGVLKGIKNGTARVIGQLGDFKDTLVVKVEVPAAAKIAADNFQVSNWTMEASSALNAALNTQNLPSNWTSGSAVNYVYTTTRAPYIKLIRNLDLYSLPDTMKVILNSGNIAISKLIVSMSTKNALQTVTKEFTTFQQNAETQISIPLASVFDVKDIAIYPVRLNYLNFYLGTQTSGQAYVLALKEIDLCYKNVILGLQTNTTFSVFSVFPNPVSENGITIQTSDNNFRNFKLNIFDVSGKQVVTAEKICTSGKMFVDIKTLPKGNYILKITSENKTESLKLIKK